MLEARTATGGGDFKPPEAVNTTKPTLLPLRVVVVEVYLHANSLL